MRNYTFRLSPGQDLFNAIEMFAKEMDIEAGCILCAVGSLTHYTLRFANQDVFAENDGFFEIVSITGTVSIHGSHIHMSISDEQGRTLGGHVVEGCKVYTTAEVVVIAFEDLVYKREFAEDSGYEELTVYER